MVRIAETRLPKALVGHHNFWKLRCGQQHSCLLGADSLGATTLLISLMATVTALPATLFTLPAGAIADMVDRKKILLAVQLWHASIAFLFSLGFAFSSPAQSAVIAEMVSSEELASAYTRLPSALIRVGCLRRKMACINYNRISS